MPAVPDRVSKLSAFHPNAPGSVPKLHGGASEPAQAVLPNLLYMRSGRFSLRLGAQLPQQLPDETLH